MTLFSTGGVIRANTNQHLQPSPPLHSNSSWEFMQEFFETVDEVKSNIHFLAKTTAQINVIKEQTSRLSAERRGRAGSGKVRG